MAGKNFKKAATSSSKVPPNKLPDIKPELVTPSQLVKYDPHQISPVNSPNIYIYMLPKYQPKRGGDLG